MSETSMFTRRGLLVSGSGAVLPDNGFWAFPPRNKASLLDYIPASEHDHVAKRRSTLDLSRSIQHAIDECSRGNIDLVIPAGTYVLKPFQILAHADPNFVCLAALLLRSSMRLRAQPGATFVIAPGVSSDAKPQPMAMFGSADVLEDVDIDGLWMDMNGASNPLSPQRRDRTYLRFPQAHVFVSGGAGKGAARIDRCRITRCRMTGSPGVSCIVSGQSNASDAVLGRDWLIAANQFADNGFDTDDHSSIFGQSDDMVVRGNHFTNPKFYDGVGGNTSHEVHGARHVFDRNLVKNYLRGVWISSSPSSPTTGTNVSNNRFETLFYGVDFFRDKDELGQISGTTISNNRFTFDDHGIAELDLKAAVQVASSFAQSAIDIRGNSVVKTGARIASAFLVIAQGERGPGVHDRIEAVDNEGSGLTFGVFARTSRTAGLGRLTFLDNDWTNLTRAGIFAVASGYAIERTVITQPVQSLTVGGGSSTGQGPDVSTIFINTRVRTLTLKPLKVAGTKQALVRGGASRIDALIGSIAFNGR